MKSKKKESNFSGDCEGPVHIDDRKSCVDFAIILADENIGCLDSLSLAITSDF